MDTTDGKRTAKVKLTLTKRTVDNLQPADRPWIAWDDRLIGFGVRVQPSGAKSFLINYRIGSGGRKARNRRIAIGRCGRLAPEDARRLAQELLGRVARGEDPAQANFYRNAGTTRASEGAVPLDSPTPAGHLVYAELRRGCGPESHADVQRGPAT